MIEAHTVVKTTDDCFLHLLFVLYKIKTLNNQNKQDVLCATSTVVSDTTENEGNHGLRSLGKGLERNG